MIVWDVTLSCILLGVTVLIGGCAAIMGMFSLMFLDDCPPETCSAGGAFSAVSIALVIAGVVGAVGLIVAIVRMNKRRVSWPISLGTLVACSVIIVVGGYGWASAVGA
ncbi:hypothetical protein FOY51_16605 [Antrihabitans cavernicola]|uniref:Uncharacterized protein n=2 Tax=Antrihabitans cavernicola TaxID=2495913 RepID=A0A5A7SC82_9NOCA|nr:hypothetical protein FOY51_16605 [Spelaeibacter cavernicola]